MGGPTIGIIGSEGWARVYQVPEAVVREDMGTLICTGEDFVAIFSSAADVPLVVTL